MRSAFHFLALLFALAACAFGETVISWNAGNGFPGIDDSHNLEYTITDKSLILNNLLYDSSLTFRGLALDPGRCAALVIRYRATETGDRSGQLYFTNILARKFEESFKWVIPPLVADGEWHEVRIESRNLQDRAKWYGGGTVDSIRLDPTDSAGGRVEIEFFRFEGDGGPASKTATAWSSASDFGEWNESRNATTEIVGDCLAIAISAGDPQVINRDVKIDPLEFDSVVIRYKATGVGDRPGQLYYSHEGEGFSDGMYWSVPPLENDGEWHVATLSRASLVNSSSWFNGGIITALRLDPTDSGMGRVLVSDIHFAVMDEKRLARTKGESPLARVAPVLDAPEWPALKAHFTAYPPIATAVDNRAAYFTCKMMTSPDDKKGGGEFKEFYIRGNAVLKARPAAAWLQFTADDAAECFVNGASVAAFGNWRDVCVVDVTDSLGAGENAIGFRYVNLEHEGGVMFELFVRYGDGSWERFNSGDGFFCSVVPEGKWSEPGFDPAEWKAVQLHDAAPARPWTAVLPYRDMANAQKSIEMSATPAKAVAGQETSLRLEMEGRMPTLPFSAKLQLLHGGNVIWEEGAEISDENARETGGGRWAIDLKFTVPLYFSSADCRIRIVSPLLANEQCAFPEAALSIERAASIPGFEERPTFKVSMESGHPAFNLNGRPVFPVWSGVGYNSRPDRRPFHGTGKVDIVTLYTKVDEIWRDMDTLNMFVYDRQAELYRRENPDAYFVVDIQCYVPRIAWARMHPEDVCLDDGGKPNKDGGCLNYSFASGQLREDLESYLAKVLEYLEQSPYANRIIGYRITGGHTLEWLGWDPAPGHTVDFSPASARAFAEYAAAKYPAVKNAAVPPMAERQQGDDGMVLWDQKEHLRAVAYTDFYSDAVADIMLGLCAKARGIVGENKVIGTYYGYTMTLGAPGNAHMRAHYALKKVLDSKCIDFLISPHPYGLRNIGDIMGDMKPFSTMMDNGIVPVIEDDSRTFNGPSGLGYYQMVSEDSSISVIRRNIGTTLCRNGQYYSYNLSAGTEFDFDAAQKCLATMRTVGQHCLEKSVERKTQVALVVSEESIKAMPMLKQWTLSGELAQTYEMDGSVRRFERGSALLTGELLSENYIRFARTGAPMDYVLAEDLEDHPGDYRLYVFLNCFKYDVSFLRAVDALRARGCTMLWVYAPGYAFGLENGVYNMKRLTGFDMAMAERALLPAATLADGRVMGLRTLRMEPMFHVLDKDAEVIGRYEDGSVGIAARRTGASLSVFTGVWKFDVPFLKDVLARAGVHMFCDSSDPVEANEALFTLHARFPGKKHIRLPAKTDVIDVFDARLVASGVDEFEFDAPLHSSYLFYYGDDANELLGKLRR